MVAFHGRTSSNLHGHQHLIGARPERLRVFAATPDPAFGLGERQCAIAAPSQRWDAGSAFDLRLVDLGRLEPENDAGSCQNRPRTELAEARISPLFAEPWRRASSFRIAAAVSSIERRVTSITGQCCSAKIRRASRTSARTASWSV